MNDAIQQQDNKQEPEERKLRGIYEREPGSSIWWIRYADTTGRIRREKAGTKGAAIKLYQKRKTEVLQGKKLPENLRAPMVGFAELAKDALAYSQAHKRSYGDDVIRMEKLLFSFRGRSAESITPRELERFLAENAEENEWAPATINRYRALLSLVYRLGIESGKVKENPARLVKHRQENNTRVRWLSNEEEVRLRTYIQNTFPEHIQELDLALHTGMRLGEMYSLTWENVNTSRKVLTIPRSKNGETRHVPLNATAISALAELRKRGDGTGPIVRNLDGDPLAGPRYWFEPALPKAKVRRFSWHCLRHTFASRLVMAGVDLRTVQELMGHKSIEMTVRYSHLAPKHTLAAVERLTVTDSANSTGTTTSTGTPEQNETEVGRVQ
ncbi:MAG TPA: site-specific integrase [Candidatus Acidoferrum sp.]|nr:site-specific integrase [Candidatus Acidoferrum sp.]